MAYSNSTQKVVYSLVWVGVGVLILAGCAQRNYKQEIDKQVYGIIDEKWQEDFGLKVNYKVSDTEPEPDSVQVEKKVPASGILTLSQAVAIATAHNRQYQAEKEALYVKAMDLRLARHEFERKYLGGGWAGYSRSPGREGTDVSGQAGFGQLLEDGTLITSSIAASWLDVLRGNVQGGLGTVLTVAVSKPLLRGSDRAVVQETLTQAERDMLYQVRLFNRFRKSFVVSVISRYYRVLEQRNIMKNAEDNYRTLADLYEKAHKLADAGRLPLYEFDQARQDKLRAWDTYIRETKGYEQLLDEFKLTLSLPTRTEFGLDEGEIKVLKSASIPAPDFSQAQAVDAALSQRLDLANSAARVQDADRKVRVAADNLRGELNLAASTDVSSERGYDLSKLESINGAGTVGLELDLPLERTAEENAYRMALITLNRRQREYEQAKDTVTLEVRQAYRDLTEAAERYRVQSHSCELAQQRFRKTFLLLQYGRANTRDVLDAQEDLFDARNDTAAALVEHTIATLNFYRDAGVLLVRPDGMWQR